MPFTPGSAHRHVHVPVRERPRPGFGHISDVVATLNGQDRVIGALCRGNLLERALFRLGLIR